MHLSRQNEESRGNEVCASRDHHKPEDRHDRALIMDSEKRIRPLDDACSVQDDCRCGAGKRRNEGPYSVPLHKRVLLEKDEGDEREHRNDEMLEEACPVEKEIPGALRIERNKDKEHDDERQKKAR